MNSFPVPDDASEEVKKSLFHDAMKSNWNQVIQTYQQNQSAHTAKITTSGDTALHIAISNGEESVVEHLVAAACETPGALESKNELGNTPLHLAAYLGNARMCRCLAHSRTSLLGIRNADNDTPFFLAVRHGRTEAFHALHSAFRPGEGYDYCRREDGDTILHSAISGEYFELAFEIMNKYEKVVNAVNEVGLSALHILANKPSAFRSGSHIRGLQKLIYHCIFVDELQQKTRQVVDADLLHYNKNAVYPENYHTCVGIIYLFRNMRRALLGYSRSNDEEDTRGQEAQTHRHVVSRANAERLQSKAKWGRKNGQEFLPKNYTTFFNFIKLISKAMLVILGFGSKAVEKMREKKAKHIWSLQIMDQLLDQASLYQYENNGRSPDNEAPSLPPDIMEEQQPTIKGCSETPILLAAKNGVVEMVERILERFPVAIHDVNSEKKNVVLLAVENRHPHVYKMLLERSKMKETIFRKTDKDGNSALHLAARLGEHRPWLIPGAALQMQWEIKWYEFVKDSMPLHFFPRYNNQGKTPRDIFSETHGHLTKEGSSWLTSTSESCSVVAALIATVAFATSATVPGGVKSDSGTPTLQGETAFSIFAISSLVALCFSVTSVVMFLAILTSRYQEKDFGRDLPRKLLVGLTSLFISIASMLLSFCAGHFFVLKDKLQYAAFPMYAVTCLPVTFFAAAQFPLYFDLVWATIRKVPQRSSK